MNKAKKKVNARDLKPSKDAKGGRHATVTTTTTTSAAVGTALVRSRPTPSGAVADTRSSNSGYGRTAV